MPGFHDLSVENLRLHERIVEEEKHTKNHVVKTATSAPTTTKHSSSVRPPAKPATLVRSSQADSKAGSKTGFKAGSKREASEHNKEVLVVTVTYEEDADDEEKNLLPPKAPSIATSKHSSSKKQKASSSAKPPASKVSSSLHYSHHSNNHSNKDWDIYHIPTGMPLPPGFSKLPELVEVPNLDVQNPNEMALAKLPSSPAAKSITSATTPPSNLVAKRFPASSQHTTSSHCSKTSSHHNKAKKALETTTTNTRDVVEFRDVVFEEVREVTKRRYVVKMPGR